MFQLAVSVCCTLIEVEVIQCDANISETTSTFSPFDVGNRAMELSFQRATLSVL